MGKIKIDFNANDFIERLIRMLVTKPGIKINREKFLRKELSKYIDSERVEKAILTNPAQAGISIDDLERIAKGCINLETTTVTAVSAAAGIPGGWLMAASIPADIMQFLAHVVIMLQKLAYLYSWQEIIVDEKDEFDDGTIHQIILFMGVMFGVGGAGVLINKFAAMAAQAAEKRLVRQALMKGTIYPIVKKIAFVLGAKMNKAIFAKGVGKAIPIAGAVVSGGMTYAGFKPLATRLKNYLKKLPTADVKFYKQQSKLFSENIIDVDFSDIIIEAGNEETDDLLVTVAE